LYAVGGFTRISGVEAPGVARWDGANWTAIQPALSARVVSAVASGSTAYFATQRASADQAAGLLRWDGSAWTDLGIPVGYTDIVGETLVANGPDIYAEVVPVLPPSGPYPLKAVAKWNGSHWSVLADTASVGSYPSGLATAGGELYASGALSVPGQPAPLNLGRLEQGRWVPVGGGVGDGLSVYGIASDGANLFAYGAFRHVGGQTADGFAIWDGGAWIIPPAASRDGFRVTALSADGDVVFASEALSSEPVVGETATPQRVVQYVGAQRTVVARGDAPGMTRMKRWGNAVYGTGAFRAVGGVLTGNLAKWDGAEWSQVGRGTLEGLSGAATCLAVGVTNVFVAGTFEYAGGVAARHIARWDGARWHALGAGIGGRIIQMAALGDRLYVIGEFSAAGDVAANNVASWDGTNWSAFGGGLSGALMAITAAGADVYVARVLDGTDAVVSRWDGVTWTDVARGFIGYWPIHCVAVVDGSILIGGRFPEIAGRTVNNIARWDGREWVALGEGLTGHAPPLPNEYSFAEVRALVVAGTNLYVGGSYTNAGGVAAMNVARWDGERWSALGNGLPGFGACLFGACNFPVTALAMVRGKLFAGGGFDARDGSALNYLACWDGNQWTGLAPGNWTFDHAGWTQSGPFQLHVWALAARGDDLYVAGNFATVGALPSYGFAIWHEAERPSLRARLESGQVVLFWPRQFEGAVLEFSETLMPGSWQTLRGPGQGPGAEAIDDVEVTLPPAGLRRFFRLRLGDP
jgi:hypothetical protein